MIAFLRLLSPSSWVILGLVAVIAASGVALKVQSGWLDDCKAEKVELESQVKSYAQKIDMFRAEAALMGESLKKHKKIAADLRKTSKKKERDIVKQPVIAECNKAVVSSALRSKESLKQAFGE